MGIKQISAVIIATSLMGTVTAFAHQPFGADMPFMQHPLCCDCETKRPPRLLPGPPEVREQIEDLLDTEQVTIMPLIQKLHLNRSALRKAMAKKPLDENAVARLASERAGLQTELMVSRLRTQSKIHDLLEQNRPAKR